MKNMKINLKSAHGLMIITMFSHFRTYMIDRRGLCHRWLILFHMLPLDGGNAPLRQLPSTIKQIEKD